MTYLWLALGFVVASAVAGVMYLVYYGVVNFADGFVPGVKAFTAATSIRPELGAKRPATSRPRVDFPDPLSPTRP